MDQIVRKYKEKFKVYKPNRELKGAAFQVDFALDKQCCFLEFAKQKKEQEFDWGNKITLKASVTDIGKILAVLNNRASSVKLYHDPSKGQYSLAQEVKNNALEMTKGQYGYLIRISSQAQDKTVNAIQVSLSDDEAEILKIVLTKAVEGIYAW